jgi:hypothetical protein
MGPVLDLNLSNKYGVFWEFRYQRERITNQLLYQLSYAGMPLESVAIGR